MVRVKFLLRSDNNRRLQVKLARKVKSRDGGTESATTENGLINRVNCPFTTWTEKKKSRFHWTFTRHFHSESPNFYALQGLLVQGILHIITFPFASLFLVLSRF